MTSLPNSAKDCFIYDRYCGIDRFRYSLIPHILFGSDRGYSALVLIRLHQYFHARFERCARSAAGPFGVLMRKLYAFLCRLAAGYNFTWNAGVQVSPLASIGQGLYFHHCQATIIGGDTRLGRNVHLFKNVLFGEKNDKYPVIGDNCILYANACVIGGVRIGNNCIVAPNSVVLDDVPPGKIVAGSPAKVIKDSYYYYAVVGGAPVKTALSTGKVLK